MTKPIAVIGIGAVLPEAMDLSEYWSNILTAKDCIKDTPENYWEIKDFYDPDPVARDKTYGYRGGFLDPIEFDSIGFGIPPTAMEAISVEQLFALVVAKQALLDADMIGKNAKPFNKEKTGVILAAGIGKNAFSYSRRQDMPRIRTILRNSGVPEELVERIISRMTDIELEWTENSEPGYLANVTAGRIANRFDFSGINCAVDAACASSLAVMKFAMTELQSGDSDVVLAGGVNLDLTASAFVSFCKTPAISRSNLSRPFDQDADGMILGDGVTMVVLKRLEDAERDRDRIYAVVKSVGASGDGRAKSIFAPRREGQKLALSRAYEKTDVDPGTVTLVEAHGTGTQVGDGCELAALSEFYSEHGSEQTSVVIGSVKSQIGHTRLSAGMAGFIKVALSLYHKTLPPTINIKTQRESMEGTPFYTLAKPKPWITSRKQPIRRAGLSSFGFGGTNFHAVLEEYVPEKVDWRRVNRIPAAICLHGETKAALIGQCNNYLQSIKSDTVAYYELLEEQRNTEAIPANYPRLGFAADSRDEVVRKLQIAIDELMANEKKEWRKDSDGIFFRSEGLPEDAKTVSLFSGQGAQYLDMFNEVARNYPEMGEFLSIVDDEMIDMGLSPVSEVVFATTLNGADRAKAELKLKDTKYTQPALAAVCGGLYSILKSRGYSEDFMIGHSFGEITGLWAGGSINEETFAKIAAMRGFVMSSGKEDFGEGSGPSEETGMAAVSADKERCMELLKGYDKLYIANENSDVQTAISGDMIQIKNLLAELKGKGVSATILNVSCAFHSPYMAEPNRVFKETISMSKFSPLKGDLYSGADGTLYGKSAASVKKTLSQQIERPVLFRSSVLDAYEKGARVFVEIGPGRILSGLTARILAGKEHYVISVNGGGNKSELMQLEETFVQLRVLGQNPAADPYAKTIGEIMKSDKPKSSYLVDPMVFLTPAKKALNDAALDVIDEPMYALKVAEDMRNEKGDDDVRKGELDAVFGLQSLNGQALEQFLASQGYQIEVFKELLRNMEPGSRPEDVLRFVEVFQHNSMQAFESYIQGQRRILGNMENLEGFQSAEDQIFGGYQNQVIYGQQMQTQRLLYGQQYRTKAIYDQPNQVMQPAYGQQNQAHPAYDQPNKGMQPIYGQPNQTQPYSQSAYGQPAQVQPAYGQPNQGMQPTYGQQNQVRAAYGQQGQTQNVMQNAAYAGVPPVDYAGSQGLPLKSVALTPMGGAATAAQRTAVSFDASFDLTGTIIKIICDKTGYPEEMVDAEMNIESDLGIDSIKRIEIFSELNNQIPGGLEKEDIESIAMFHTIVEISDYLKKKERAVA